MFTAEFFFFLLLFFSPLFLFLPHCLWHSTALSIPPWVPFLFVSVSISPCVLSLSVLYYILYTLPLPLIVSVCFTPRQFVGYSSLFRLSLYLSIHRFRLLFSISLSLPFFLFCLEINSKFQLSFFSFAFPKIYWLFLGYVCPARCS